MMRIPGWLREAARPARGPVPWAGMGLGALAVGVPLAAGLADGQPVKGVLMALGGLIGAMANRISPYLIRMRRVAFSGIFGATGLLIGAVISGHGWLAVAVMMAVAGVSALLSSISATWSTAGMFLLVYAALGTGPVGALRPWWETLAWLLAGVGWALVLMVPGWLRHPRAVEESRVAAVYRALAAGLRAPGTNGFAATRQGVVTALNVAYEELLGQRAAATGRDRRLARLVALLNQARLVAEAAAALTYAGEQAPPQAAAQADRIAEAVVGGAAVSGIGRPPESRTWPNTMIRCPCGSPACCVVRSASCMVISPSPSSGPVTSVSRCGSSTSGCFGWRSAVDLYAGESSGGWLPGCGFMYSGKASLPEPGTTSPCSDTVTVV